jgi:hypothetical protein
MNSVRLVVIASPVMRRVTSLLYFPLEGEVQDEHPTMCAVTLQQ